MLLAAMSLFSTPGSTQNQPYGVVSPTSINFGDVLVGQTSPQKRVSLKNTGDSELTISNISLSGHFALPVNHCGSGVKPGTHCDVYVTYSPVEVGTDSGTLTFTDNASNSPQTVALAGTGANTAPTKTTVTASPKSIMAGQNVTFTATVVSLGGGTIPDGEQVNFVWGGGGLGLASLQGGVATITGPLNWRGQDTQKVTAEYAGDQTFEPSHSAVDVAVYRYQPTVTLTTSPNPSFYREPVTFMVNITSGSPVPAAGTIWAICPPPTYVTVSGGVAAETCDLKEDAGSYQFGAQYRGDHYNLPGDSTGGYTQVISPSPTTAALKSSKNPSKQGQQVTFSVVVTAEYGKDYVSGSVTFTSGQSTIGTVELDHGRGSITTSSLPVGQDSIAATFAPDDGNYLSSSASLSQTVQ
jgi:hypothetical protein